MTDPDPNVVPTPSGRSGGVATPQAADSEGFRQCRGPDCSVEFRPRHDEHWHCSGPCRTRAWEREHPRVGRAPRQLELDQVPAPELQAGPPDAGPEEAARLSRQARAIRARLEEGPASNHELLGIAQRFGARLHELRHQAGLVVEIVERDRATGRTVYQLFDSEAAFEAWRAEREAEAKS